VTRPSLEIQISRDPSHAVEQVIAHPDLGLSPPLSEWHPAQQLLVRHRVHFGPYPLQARNLSSGSSAQHVQQRRSRLGNLRRTLPVTYLLVAQPRQEIITQAQVGISSAFGMVGSLFSLLDETRQLALDQSQAWRDRIIEVRSW